MRCRWATRAGLTALLAWTAIASGHGDAPDMAMDYGRGRIVGMKGRIEWESMLHGDGLDGWEATDTQTWSRDGDAILSDAGGREHENQLAQGDSTWDHYEFKVQGTLVKGANLQILFGLSDDSQEFYMLDFLSAWKALSISKFVRGKPGVEKLDVVNFVAERGREYDIVIAVRGRSVTSYIDGHLVNRVTLEANPRGKVALATWGKQSAARFRDPKIRHYY